MLTIITKIIKTIVLVLSMIFFMIISLYLLEEEKPPVFIFEKNLGKGNFGNVTLYRTSPQELYFEDHPYVAIKQMKYWELSPEFHILKNLNHR